MTPEDEKACRKCRDQFGSDFNYFALILAMIFLLRWIGSQFKDGVPESFR